MIRESFPNPDRPERWPGEEDHYRSDLQIGDIVRAPYGYLGRLTAWNNTWSHLTAGRIAHLEPLLTYPGTPAPPNAKLQGRSSSWESALQRAEPGDVARHTVPDTDRPWDVVWVDSTWKMWFEGEGPNRWTAEQISAVFRKKYP